MSKEPQCDCKQPKPVTITDEQFDGMFSDVPIYVATWRMCDKCGRLLGKPPK